MEIRTIKTIRTAFLIVMGMLTWNSITSWWSNWLTLTLLIIDLMCVLITFIVTKQKKPAGGTAGK